MLISYPAWTTLSLSWLFYFMNSIYLLKNEDYQGGWIFSLATLVVKLWSSFLLDGKNCSASPLKCPAPPASAWDLPTSQRSRDTTGPNGTPGQCLSRWTNY